MKIYFFPVIFSFLFFGCKQHSGKDFLEINGVVFPDKNKKELIEKIFSSDHRLKIRYGHYFGMCQGYCQKQFVVTPEGTMLILKSWENNSSVEFKTLGKVWTPDDRNFEILKSLIDFKEIDSMQTVYGCPDCTDGGAEWFEIEYAGKSKKVLFEYADSLPGNQKLLKELRKLNSKLPRN